MTYLQRFPSNTHKKNWICSCGRKNGNEDTVCAFCKRERPEKKSSKDPNNARVRSTRTEYNGRWYQSAGECEYAKELDFRMSAGEIIDIKPQYKITIKVAGVFIANYYCDFRVVLRDQTVQYHEYKGHIMQLFQIKWKLLNALKDELLEPGAELLLIKHQSNWKVKR
jgi:hypothetical protein